MSGAPGPASMPDLTRGLRPTSERLAEIAAPGYVDGLFDKFAERQPALFIGNEWVPPAAGESAETLDPSTGRAIGRFPVADPGDVDRAIRVAADAQPAWAALNMQQRGECLRTLADLIAERGNDLATADAIDAGLPVARMLNDINGMVRALRGWAGLALSLRGEVVETLPGLHYTRYAPYGVVARIVAFNHPILFAVKGCCVPLVAGNTVVLKPGDQTPLSALMLGELIQEAFPPGVFNVITGGPPAGEALVTHPLVRRIAFTGSDRVGRLIQETAARDQVRNVSLELGGKNPMIVFPDVDIAAAAQDAVFGMNLRANQGQSCGSTSRVFVHRDIHDEFVQALSKALGALELGPAYHTDVDMGPMITETAAQRTRAYIEAGAEEGATLVSGGNDDPRLPDEGYFVAPTLFTDVPERSKIACEEIFGPVISVFPWHDLDAVIDAANSVEYGLTSSVWTNDLNAALTTADRLQTGYVWINESTTHYWGTPFGGWKNSGVGREESMDELRSYMQLKAVHVKLPS